MNRFRLLAASAVFCGLLYGQGGTGSITGSVTDSSDALVPGVVVTATNQGNGFKREATVTSAGEYSLNQSGLPLTVKFNGNVFGSGTDNARPDLVCNPNLDGGSRTVDRFFDTNCFKIQSPIRCGTAGRSTEIGPVVNNFDAGILKNCHNRTHQYAASRGVL